MTLKRKETGFSIIECLVVLLIVSSISIVSLSSFKALSNKTKEASKQDDATKLLYSYCDKITQMQDIYAFFDNGKFYALSYPLLSSRPSVGNSDDDDTDYDIICRYVLKVIFDRVKGFENGTFEYQPVYFKNAMGSEDNDITYRCQKGTIITHCTIKNALTGSRDTLSFNGFTYIDNNGVSVTVKL